jgi:hypothetical protein
MGGLVDVMTSIVLDMPLAVYGMAKVNTSHISENRTTTAVMAATAQQSISLYVAQLLIGLACSILGGYVAAWLAKRNELLNGALSSFLCVLLGICTMALGKSSDGLWVQLLLLVASPVMALLGGELMRRRRRALLHRAS